MEDFHIDENDPCHREFGAAGSFPKTSAGPFGKVRTVLREPRVLIVVLCALVSTTMIDAKAQHGIPRDQRLPSRSLIEDFNAGLGATNSRVARPLLPLAPNLIMDFEGWEPSPYDDPSGYCTVGYGHLLKKDKCVTLDLSGYSKPLTKAQGESLMEGDTRTARIAVQTHVTRELLDYQFGALSSFAFNVGKENFAGSTLRSLVNDGYYDAAAKEFQRWIYSKGKVLPGLVTRRACEAMLFKNQLLGDKAGHFIRAECETLGAAPATGTLIDIDTGQEVPDPRN